ncbi:MAG: carbohydrate kinase [Verrucomicrobia bacterium]|nr:carbohydrate kinase [Verrucomicrobiota bacterium]
MATICVDAGTSIIKTVAFDDYGTEIALARQETKVLRPAPGFSEQDMDSVWNAAASTIRSVVKELPNSVRLISLTAQGDGCWLVDTEGHPTGPAILWNDARAAAIVDRWREAGVLKEAFHRNGSQAFAGLPNGIFAWLKRHDPGRLERSHKSLCCNGWIFYNLTGRMAIDESDASVPFFDVRARRYSAELLELYGLEWAERLLPEVLPNDRRVGELRATAATEFGLPAGLPVVMSPYDVASTAIGVGAVSDGQACSILGTTLCTNVVMNQVNLEGEPSGLTLPFGPPGLYLRAFPTLAGAEVIHWAVRQLGLSGVSDLSALAAKAEPGANGLCFLPYLSPAGERVPFLNTGARGSIFGLSFEHGREHIARSVLEGLSLVIRDCLQASHEAAASLSNCGLCGGGANSDVWCQLISDVIGRPTFRPMDQEVGAKGAFIAGLVATGQEEDFPSAAKDYVRIRDMFEPDSERHARYNEIFEHFLAIRESTRPIWKRMADDRVRRAEPTA